MKEGTYTFTIIKPSAVRKEYVGQILDKINNAGYHIASLKMIWLSVPEARTFYAVHEGKPFYDSLIQKMTSGPVVVAILEKPNAVKDYRKLMGATNPAEAEEGTLRKLFGESLQVNAIHGSDSDENAKIESDFFFPVMERYSKSAKKKLI